MIPIAGRRACRLAAVALAIALPSAAHAQVDPARLPAADRTAVQEVLEHTRTGEPRDLPGGGRMTVTATETQPRVCRTFRLEHGGATAVGTGCRTPGGAWEVESRRSPATAGAPSAVPLPPRRPGSGPAVAAEQTPFPAPLPAPKPGHAPTPSFPLPPGKPAPG